MGTETFPYFLFLFFPSSSIGFEGPIVGDQSCSSNVFITIPRGLLAVGKSGSKMGETLKIAHNVFEKMERERDRKERLKKYEDWQKEKVKKKQRLKEIQHRIKEVEKSKPGSLGGPSSMDDGINDGQGSGSESPDDEDFNEKSELVQESSPETQQATPHSPGPEAKSPKEDNQLPNQNRIISDISSCIFLESLKIHCISTCLLQSSQEKKAQFWSPLHVFCAK